MALQVGDETATMGMTKAIYEKLNELLSPKIPPASLPDAQTGWKQLAFAIATGVIGHILTNMEIKDIQVSGAVSLPVAASTAAGPVTLHQSDPVTGHVA